MSLLDLNNTVVSLFSGGYGLDVFGGGEYQTLWTLFPMVVWLPDKVFSQQQTTLPDNMNNESVWCYILGWGAMCSIREHTVQILPNQVSLLQSSSVVCMSYQLQFWFFFCIQRISGIPIILGIPKSSGVPQISGTPWISGIPMIWGISKESVIYQGYH